MEYSALTKNHRSSFQTFEVWIHISMLRSSVDRVTNDEVLSRINKNIELINIIKTKRLANLGNRRG